MPPYLALTGLQDLLREVLVDHCRFQAQLVRRVHVVLWILSGHGGVERRLVDGKVVELACISLVEKQGPVELEHARHNRQM